MQEGILQGSRAHLYLQDDGRGTPRLSVPFFMYTIKIQLEGKGMIIGLSGTQER